MYSQTNRNISFLRILSLALFIVFFFRQNAKIAFETSTSMLTSPRRLYSVCF